MSPIIAVCKTFVRDSGLNRRDFAKQNSSIALSKFFSTILFTNMYIKLAVDKQRKQYVIYRIFQYTKKEVAKTVYIKDKISDDEMYTHPNGLFSS